MRYVIGGCGEGSVYLSKFGLVFDYLKILWLVFGEIIGLVY